MNDNVDEETARLNELIMRMRFEERSTDETTRISQLVGILPDQSADKSPHRDFLLFIATALQQAYMSLSADTEVYIEIGRASCRERV